MQMTQPATNNVSPLPPAPATKKGMLKDFAAYSHHVTSHLGFEVLKFSKVSMLESQHAKLPHTCASVLMHFKFFLKT